jgi:hypothetical protein
MQSGTKGEIIGDKNIIQTSNTFTIHKGQNTYFVHGGKFVWKFLLVNRPSHEKVKKKRKRDSSIDPI